MEYLYDPNTEFCVKISFNIYFYPVSVSFIKFPYQNQSQYFHSVL